MDLLPIYTPNDLNELLVKRDGYLNGSQLTINLELQLANLAGFYIAFSFESDQKTQSVRVNSE